ncbi:MAG: hypothetical protein EHM19_00555 [Candidatus Latescibacterota bacterium]|nr:MAG: hypothetical protein EHM19_00555 [Candidatus Latescibacterota bacterium]
MVRSLFAAIFLGGIIAAALAFIIVLLLVKLLWAWTVPDLFPGAVDQGLIAGTISWMTAIKIAIFVAILSAFAGRAHARGPR